MPILAIYFGHNSIDKNGKKRSWFSDGKVIPESTLLVSHHFWTSVCCSNRSAY